MSDLSVRSWIIDLHVHETFLSGLNVLRPGKKVFFLFFFYLRYFVSILDKEKLSILKHLHWWEKIQRIKQNQHIFDVIASRKTFTYVLKMNYCLISTVFAVGKISRICCTVLLKTKQKSGQTPKMLNVQLDVRYCRTHVNEPHWWSSNGRHGNNYKTLRNRVCQWWKPPRLSCRQGGVRLATNQCPETS